MRRFTTNGYAIWAISTWLTASTAHSEDLSACGPQSDSSPGLMARVLREFQTALESQPTQAQRLSALRLDFSNLANANDELIATIQSVVATDSAPDWLKTKVQLLPEVQNRVKKLLDKITIEAEQGELLASAPSLSDMNRVLSLKRNVTLCELSTVPLPLADAQREAVSRLLGDLQEEQTALKELDTALTELIAKSQVQGNSKT